MNGAALPFTSFSAFVSLAAAAFAQTTEAAPPETSELPWLMMLTIFAVVAIVVGAVVSNVFRPKRDKVIVVKDSDAE